MKITAIDVYQLDSRLLKPYWLSGGRLKFEQLDSTFVRIETDAGLVGWGEGCPWGHTYVPAFGGGIRAAATLLAPVLLGQDPRCHNQINALMDVTLPGHLYAKSALDIACWDISAQARSQPLAAALGSYYPDPIPIASSSSSGTPEEMLDTIQSFRDMDYFVHSVKVGANANLDVERIRYLERHCRDGELFFYDVNRSWLPLQAMEVMNQLAEYPVIFEQPCETLKQCLQVRQRTRQAISIDERLETMEDMLFIIQHSVAEVANIKINRVGGLTRARRLCDVALDAGLKIIVMETGGTVLADTTALHLAQSLPPASCMATWLCQEMIDIDPAPEQGARNSKGYAAIPGDVAGIGVIPDTALLGNPVSRFS